MINNYNNLSLNDFNIKDILRSLPDETWQTIKDEQKTGFRAELEQSIKQKNSSLKVDIDQMLANNEEYYEKVSGKFCDIYRFNDSSSRISLLVNSMEKAIETSADQLIKQNYPQLNAKQIANGLKNQKRTIHIRCKLQIKSILKKMDLLFANLEADILHGVETISQQLVLANNKKCHLKSSSVCSLTERADQMMQQLIKEEQAEKKAKKLKNKKSIVVETPIKKTQSLKISSVAVEKTKLTKLFKPVLGSKQTLTVATLSLELFKDSLRCAEHQRIQRWKTIDPAEIRQFVDRDSQGIQTYRYRHLNDQEILEQRSKHFLPGTERLLKKSIYKTVYTFPTNRGYGMVGQLFFEGKRQNGALYFGIDKSQIVFHKYFENVNFQEIKRNIFIDETPLEKKEILESTSWVSTHNFQLKVSQDYVLTFLYSDTHYIRIFPLRKDLIK